MAVHGLRRRSCSPTGIEHGSERARPRRSGEAPPPRRTATARGRALAGVRAAGADHGAARHVHRLPVRARHPAVGDQLARRVCPANSSGLDNFYKIWNDPIFRTAVWNTFLYTVVTTVFKLALGLWLAHAAQSQLQGQGLHPRLHPAALHHPDRAVDVRLEVDVRPDIQRPQLAAVPARPHHRPHQLAGRPRSRDDLHHRRQHLARRAVLRHQAARRPADHQPRAQRGGSHRRRQALAAVLAHHLAAAACR